MRTARGWPSQCAPYPHNACIHQFAGGVIDDAEHPPALDLDSDSDGMGGIAVNNVGCPVQRIEDPTHARAARDVGALFPKNGIIGTGAPDGGHELLCRFTIYRGDEVR
jgi:hypothetical protein